MYPEYDGRRIDVTASFNLLHQLVSLFKQSNSAVPYQVSYRPKQEDG